MLIRGGSAALAIVAIALAIAGSWLIPGLTWRGLAAMERPSAAVVQDTAATVAPTVPGAQIPAPEAATGTLEPTSLLSRLSGLVGIALILGIGIALSHNRKAI